MVALEAILLQGVGQMCCDFSLSVVMATLWGLTGGFFFFFFPFVGAGHLHDRQEWISKVKL